MSDLPKIEDLIALPVSERLAISEALWNSLVATPAAVPFPEWHRKIIQQRLRDDDPQSDPGESWDALRARIERRA